MKLRAQYVDQECYLEASDILDFDNKNLHGVADTAVAIAGRSHGTIDFIKNAYEYVRDAIPHSGDIQGKTVTCRASDVLRAREGICFAKSHLLAAILRSKRIPAGFCYQRLLLNDDEPEHFILHGLTAVHVDELDRWVRLDARGNKPGVDAQFSLDQEKLAFPVREEKGEEDIPVVFAKPDANVIAALTDNRTLESLWANLPTELATS